MEIKESILTKNPCYTAGRKISVKGLMLHSVGCAQPKASAFVNSWNSANHDNSCVHAFIDGETGVIYQTLPWNHRGWHCGSGKNGSGNNTHIGVEMCEPACIKYVGGTNITCSDLDVAKNVAERTYKAAVELFAYLCKEYSLDPLGDGVIISHKEGCSRGIASNHGDPEHLWAQLGMGYSMETFRRAVKDAMAVPVVTGGQIAGVVNKNVEVKSTEEKKYYRVRKSWEDVASQLGAYSVLDNAKALADDNPGYAVFDWNGQKVYVKGNVTETNVASDGPFVVRVSIPNLIIRKGAGTDTAKTGKYTGVGSFTIVEVTSGVGSEKGWGRLKSGAGWISLDYCQRI